MLTITTEWLCAWPRAISQDDLDVLDNVVVCERHFQKGKDFLTRYTPKLCFKLCLNIANKL